MTAGSSPTARGLLIAAPGSGSGKTVVTLSLLRALRRRGTKVVGSKSGPDYIDPRFHEAATGQPAVNLDAFAMNVSTLRTVARRASDGQEMLIVEGAMGLFDGAIDGRGSAADLALALEIPVILVLDCKGMGQSVRALTEGYTRHRDDVVVAGIILNRVGSVRHETLLRESLAALGIPVLGCIGVSTLLSLPDRHLGLVQAQEHPALDAFLDGAANTISQSVDLDAICNLATPIASADAPAALLPPLGQRIAIARDDAFAFSYAHQLMAWHNAGAEISFFSPLADEGPSLDADAVFLPGGYPELHAGKIAHAEGFREGMGVARDRDALIYGECGGYMVLGDWVVCGEKHCHRMLGFLPLETSFAERNLHLGYRQVTPLQGAPWSKPIAAHEFHYATIVAEDGAERLFEAEDAQGQKLPAMGLRSGRVMGSFAHLI